MLGLLRVCAACPTPRLNLKFELRPSWNNIHDTFPQRDRKGYNMNVLSKSGWKVIYGPGVEPRLSRLGAMNATIIAHWGDLGDTVIPRLTKIIRYGITFVSRNLR